MQVILTQDVKGIGKAFDVVKVKDGFARNFLLPNNMVLPATPKNLKVLAEQAKIKAAAVEKEKKQAGELALKLSSLSINVAMATNEEDKLYGSVTNADVAHALKEEGFDIPAEKISLDEPIKSLGIYDITVKLHPEVEAKLKLWIVKK